MAHYKKSVLCSLIVCFILGISVFLLLFTAPMLLKFYFSSYRGMSAQQSAQLATRILVFFYPSAVIGYLALYSLARLLQNIYHGRVFVHKNVCYLRILSVCCILVALITLVGTYVYYPFFFLFLAAGFIGLMLVVVKNVMQAAVALREENDLTI